LIININKINYIIKIVSVNSNFLMGVGQSKKTYGPRYDEAVKGITARQERKIAATSRRDKPEEATPLLGASEDSAALLAPYPYRKTRLMDIPYKEIIARGEPWNDPTFPHGP
jgi:hypothetical protein